MVKLEISGFIKAITNFLILTIIVIAVASYFVESAEYMGPAILGVGFVSLIMMKFLGINLSTVYPDMIFGAIDNGVLVFTAVLGANFAGVFGAIVGGVAGNTITDGIGGLFEGHIAQNQRKYEIDNLRTPLSTSLGKMSGCLLGAGVILILMWFVGLI